MQLTTYKPEEFYDVVKTSHLSVYESINSDKTVLDWVKDLGTYDFDEFDESLEFLIITSSYLIKLIVAGTQSFEHSQFFKDSPLFLPAVISWTNYMRDHGIGSDVLYNQSEAVKAMPRTVEFFISALRYEFTMYQARNRGGDTNESE